MDIEEIEFNDWQILNDMNNEERKQKSISSYYLNEWYNKIKNLTFETYIFPINTKVEDACPSILPFDKCMVRYENKSPKDSEYWGPVSTKEELIKIFYTSLRCKTNIGKFLCIRKWEDNLGNEFRCFFNTKLVAVALQSNKNINIKESVFGNIIDYIKSIEVYIPYKRCVLDIVEYNNTFKVIEFNSWETNSGAEPFSWINDTEILYPDFINSFDIVFRYNNLEKRINIDLGQPKISENINWDKVQILNPKKPSNWLITDKFIYVTNDIWLVRMTHNFKILNWKRGVYRFSNIELCENGGIFIGNEYFHYDLTKLNSRPKIIKNNYSNGLDHINYGENNLCKYGFYCLYYDKINFCKLMSDGNFKLVELNF